MKKIKKWIDCEVFKASPLFLANYSLKEYRKEISKYVDLEDWELQGEDFKHCDGMQSTFSPTKDKNIRILRVVWLREFRKNNPEDMGKLAHEVCHLVNRMCQHKGVPFDGQQNNDETFSYLVDFFVREFLSALNK